MRSVPARPVCSGLPLSLAAPIGALRNDGVTPAQTEWPMARRASSWRVWHYTWSATVVGALLLNVFWPVYPGYSIWALSLAAYPVAAALILAQRPGNRVGRVLAVVGVSAGVIFVSGWAVWTWKSQGWSAFLEAISAGAVPPVFWGAIGLLYIFPTGRTTHRGFRVVFTAFTSVVAVMAGLAPSDPGPLALTGRLNPLAGPAWVGSLYDFGRFVLLPGLIVGVWASVGRYRSSNPEVRMQLRWFMAGILAVAGLVAVVALVPETLPSPYEELTNVVVVAGFWSLPASIAIAVTRYRLYEIDRFLSRTVTYALVAAVIALVYAVPVVLLPRLLGESNDLVIAGSTLAAAAAFTPARRRIQRAVDRRFDRARYDAEREVDAFTSRLTGEIELITVTGDLDDVVRRTLAPSTSALWLRRTP